MPLTASRDTPERQGEMTLRPLAASAVVFLGAIGCLNAAGNLVPGADTAGLRVDGRIEEDKDNTGGDAADLSVRVKRGVFRFDNSVGNAVTKAEIGKVAYVEDDQTVNKDGGANHVAAGIVVDLDDNGVWVDTRLSAVAI